MDIGPIYIPAVLKLQGNLKFIFVVASTRAQAVHVVCFSWPFDRPCGRPRSAEPRSFFKKTLLFSGNQPALQSPSQDIFKKHLRLFWNQPAVQNGWLPVFFFKKTLIFVENQPALHKPSHYFLRKPPRIFLKSTYRPTLIISFFSQKNVRPVARAHGRARRTSHTISSKSHSKIWA